MLLLHYELLYYITIMSGINKVLNVISYYSITLCAKPFLRYAFVILLHYEPIITFIIIIIVIRLSGVGSRGQQLKQGAPDFPFPSHNDQLFLFWKVESFALRLSSLFVTTVR